ncbi:MAG: tetratricopeptide repeat protein [Ignavibacteriales bacterium]|nr:tetratricopeptide repeat protein [Ignavibacteriales bacterium]
MIDEPTLSQMLEQARGYVEERKLLHASQMYRRITEAAPELESAWVELSHVYSELRQYQAAENVLQRAMSRSNDPNKITFLLGNLYFRCGDSNRALTYYKQLLVHERQLSLTLRSHLEFNIALCYFSRGNFKLAESHFRKTKRIDPQFPKINESLGELLLRRNVLPEAITVLKQAIVDDPSSWIGHYLLGLAFARRRQWAGAYDEFVSAVEMDPNEPNGWQMCGEVLLALERYEEAERYLRKSLELNPQLTDAIANVGTLYLRRGDSETASECFERALSLEPRNAKALRGKEELHLMAKSRS